MQVTVIGEWDRGRLVPETVVEWIPGAVESEDGTDGREWPIASSSPAWASLAVAAGKDGHPTIVGEVDSRGRIVVSDIS
jgi:hypothetical protein